MILVKLCLFCVLLSISAGNDQLQPGLIQEFYNVFNNLSNLASMPHLMKTPDCRRDCEIYRQALQQNQIWAAQMFDANGRPSLGIFKGNTNQMGNMDQCVSSSSETFNIEGKYCIVKIYLKPLENNIFMNEIWKNGFNLSVLTSKPYQRNIIPTSETIVSTLCIPSSCNNRDVMIASREVLSVFNQTKFGFEAHVDDLLERSCAVKREYYADNPFVNFAKSFVFVMILLVFCASILDVFILHEAQNNLNLMDKFSKSFSLQRNYRALMSVENDTDSIDCLNGLRCLNYFLLFIIHYTVKFGLFLVDRSDISHFLQNPVLGALLKNACVALDLLIFSSGISQSYKIAKFLKKDDTKSVWKSLLYKYLRYLIFCMFFLVFQSIPINKNKLNLIYTPAENKPNIWSILLCFNNFYGFSNMYFLPAHSFFTDVQLHFGCCILLILTRRCDNKTKLIFFVALGSLFCRSLFLFFHSDIPAFVTFGMSLNQMNRFLSFMYLMPFSRLPFYMSGVALGYHMRESSNPIAVSSLNKKIGWIIALLCLFIALFCHHLMGSHFHHSDSSFNGAVISFITSFCWIIFFIWMVLYCEIIEKSSSINRFLAADVFIILNRLISYFSILHIFIIARFVLDSRLLFEYKLSEILGLDYLLFTVLSCVFVMLFIHLPLKNTWDNLITKKGDRPIGKIGIHVADTSKIRQKHE